MTINSQLSQLIAKLREDIRILDTGMDPGLVRELVAELECALTKREIEEEQLAEAETCCIAEYDRNAGYRRASIRSAPYWSDLAEREAERRALGGES